MVLAAGVIIQKQRGVSIHPVLEVIVDQEVVRREGDHALRPVSRRQEHIQELPVVPGDTSHHSSKVRESPK